MLQPGGDKTPTFRVQRPCLFPLIEVITRPQRIESVHSSLFFTRNVEQMFCKLNCYVNHLDNSFVAYCALFHDWHDFEM